MSASRRDFLTVGSLAALGLIADAQEPEQKPNTPQQASTPGAPTAFGTSPAVGPAVTPEDFQHAEKLVEVEMASAELQQAASNWPQQMAGLYELRTGPRKLDMPQSVAP